MDKYSANKLNKYLENAYWKNSQFIYVSPLEVISNDSHCYDVYSWTPTPEKDYPYETDKYLFDIVTLQYFNFPQGLGVHTYLSKQDFAGYRSCRDREEVALASNMPFYMDEPMDDWKWRRFLLKKFTPITNDDILTCSKYFFREVLDSFFLFNIKLIGTLNDSDNKE